MSVPKFNNKEDLVNIGYQKLAMHTLAYLVLKGMEKKEEEIKPRNDIYWRHAINKKQEMKRKIDHFTTLYTYDYNRLCVTKGMLSSTIDTGCKEDINVFRKAVESGGTGLTGYRMFYGKTDEIFTLLEKYISNARLIYNTIIQNLYEDRRIVVTGETNKELYNKIITTTIYRPTNP